jgi:hypothetical protein
MGDDLSAAELEAIHCWERDDRVPRRPEMTAFRRRARAHQARWRAANRHPIGTQPIVPRPPGPPARLVGSRLPLEYAHETGANFLTAGALAAATSRTAQKEPQQSFDRRRLWADLLSSEALACNLFGDLAGDLELADRAVHVLWPDAPGTVSEVRFAHSPGRLDPAYTGNLIAFDAAFVLDLGDGTRGIIAVNTPFHERLKRQLPKPERLPRYRRVHDTSHAFGPHALDAVNATDLLMTWLGHLLMLSMLQHPSGTWRWGRFAIVHPAGNTDQADGCERYRSILADESTFSCLTLEALLDAGALAPPTVRALRHRYVDG